MQKKILVGYDGSPAAHRAVDFAVDRARFRGEGVLIAHVLEWSPYSFLTPTEIEERHKRRKEELERAQRAIIDPLLDSLKDSGVPVECAMRYGHIAETLSTMAGEDDISLVIIGRMGRAGLGSRVFGSVAGTLAQIAPVPVTIVP